MQEGDKYTISHVARAYRVMATLNKGTERATSGNSEKIDEPSKQLKGVRATVHNFTLPFPFNTLI